MFKCGLCKKQSKAGEKAEKVVTHKRMRHYPSQPVDGKTMESDSEDENYKGSFRKSKIKMGRAGDGWEVATEINACPRCMKKTLPEPIVVT